MFSSASTQSAHTYPTQSKACLFFCNSAGGGINIKHYTVDYQARFFSERGKSVAQLVTSQPSGQLNQRTPTQSEACLVFGTVPAVCMD